MTRAIVEENIEGVVAAHGRRHASTSCSSTGGITATRAISTRSTHLAALRDEGKIRHLALTNFDTEHLNVIVEHGIRIVSNQVQYSLIDRRPEVRMSQFCQAQDIQLLTYGTVAGGLLSARYLGQPEPTRSALTTASLRKYKQMIDAWGGWGLFQELLASLERIADKHHVSLANVAVRYILDRPAVAGVIVGTRLGVADHREENARVFSFALDCRGSGADRGRLGARRAILPPDRRLRGRIPSLMQA